MDFFKQLSSTGHVDLSLRIMQDKSGKLTVSTLPGIKSSGVQPINFTGTPEELDEEFFSKILPGINEVKGIVTNIEQVKKDLEEESKNKKQPEKKDEKPAAKSKKESSKKKATKPKSNAKAEPQEDAEEAEPSLFETPAAETQVEETNS